MQLRHTELRVCVFVLLLLCAAGGLVSTNRRSRCRSISGIVASDKRLNTLARALRETQLQDLLADECLSATFFAPTDLAIANSEWPEWRGNESALIGSLLFHLVPFQVNVPAASTELPTALGLDHRLYMQPRIHGDAHAREPLGIVAPSREQYIKPSKILDTIETCEGMVHITDAVLQPPTEGLQMKAVRHALSGLEAMVAMASAHKARGSCRRSQKVWQRPNANDDVYREAAVQLGRGRIASEVQPTSLEQALMVARGAAQAHTEDDRQAELEAEREEEDKKRKERTQEPEKESKEDDRSDEDRSVQERMQQAKRSQGDALVSARRAYVAALQQESRTVSESAEQWLAAMQAASEKIEAAFTEASEADDSEVGHIVIAARVAQFLSEAALAQRSALSMARGADWTSKLIGLEGLVSESSAGRKWEELLTRAQDDCTEAIDSLASLTGLLRDQAQALKENQQKADVSEKGPRMKEAKAAGQAEDSPRSKQARPKKSQARRPGQARLKLRGKSVPLKQIGQSGLQADQQGSAVQGKVQTGKGTSFGGNGKSTGSSAGAKQQPASIKQSAMEGSKQSEQTSGLERLRST